MEHSQGANGWTLIDLTHPVPTFEAQAGNPVEADLDKPLSDYALHSSYGGQAILWHRHIPHNHGRMKSGRIVVGEHHGTHADAPIHFTNNDLSRLDSGLPDQRSLAEIDINQLVGPAVIIDISARVQAELDKNGGLPSPDPSVTDFGNASNNVVTADDIDAVADRLEDGVWLVLNLGWSQFFFTGADLAASPYMNGFNHPGMNREAVDKVIALMDQKKVKIGGIMADNVSIETGETAKGEDENRTNSLHAHVRLLQRGVLLVENITNLDALCAAAEKGPCTVVVGALRIAGATGAPARVFAICR